MPSETCIHCSTPLPDGSQLCAQCGTPVPGSSYSDMPTLTPQGREIFERLQEATEGKYEIFRELGRGGMAFVFLGRQKSLDRLVAIKVLLPMLAYDPELVERFMREAKTQGKLDHPNIINVFEVYNESGLSFFTVPFIQGQSLRGYLKDNLQPPIPKIRRYIAQAADALAYAHRRGVVHRDIKPDNMLIDGERDRIVITDFGIAKALQAETTLTTPGDLLGTPQYMSPEQGEGRQDLDGRADQYSLALIAWEMLAGRRPFQADNLAELMYLHRFEEPDDIDEIRPDAPRNMRAAIKRSISKDREERFASMIEFQEAFEAPDDVVVEAPAAKQEPPTGLDEETIRIPTPTSLREKVAPPEDAEATEAWTPSDEKMPWDQTATPATPAAAAPATVDESDTVLLQTGEPRKRSRIGLLVGGSMVVVVAAALVFVFDPFQIGQEAFRGPVTAQPGTETPQGTQDDREGGAEGGGQDDAALATVDPAGGGTPEGGETPGGTGEGGGAQTGGAQVGDTPTDDTPVDAGQGEVEPPDDSRTQYEAEQARNARRSASDWRDAAITAGAATLLQPRLDSLDSVLAEADRQIADGNYAAARASLSELIRGYTALRNDASSASDAADAVRTAATQARRSALAQQSNVVQAGGEVFLASELQALNGRMQQAQTALDDERFEDASDMYTQLATELEALASRVLTEGAASARAAQQEMEGQRTAANDAGANEYVPEDLANADAIRISAMTAQGEERYADAVTLFAQARDAYTQVAIDAAAAVPVLSAEDQVSALIEQFRVLFEQEEIGRMGSELYGGEVPESDADLMNYIFGLAEGISATSTVERLEVEGNTATADIRLDLDFRNQRTGSNQDMDMRLRLDFQSASDGWRLRSLRRR
jgi:serine/threonine protein kinase